MNIPATLTFAPSTEADAADYVAAARASDIRLRLVGGDTKAAIGCPTLDETILSAASLSGITLYEPAELVVAARAGTPLSMVQALLAERGQSLCFEPMDYRPLLGSTGEPTLGGVAAANLSGPRRINAGAARDSLLGVRFVNGLGEVIKSGGRVMKNVTGLDLVKLMSGSWGTLGFLTEVTFKVLPVAERVSTVLLTGLDNGSAIDALGTALGSPYEVTGAAHLPRGLDGERARTLIRLEGSPTSVTYRLGQIARLLRRFGSVDTIEGPASDRTWVAIRDALPLAEPRERAVWRISVAPSRGPHVTAEIAGACDAVFFYDWGGGLIWLSVSPEADAANSVVRSAVRRSGGHATLVRAPYTLRASVPVFEPLSEAVMRITARVKAAHDPAGLFNRGRMYAGI